MILIGSYFLVPILVAPGYVLAVVAIAADNRPLLGWVLVGAVMISCLTFGHFADTGEIGEVGFYTAMAYGILWLAIFVYIMGKGVVELIGTIGGLLF